ncbi:hypothetical protein MJO29_011152 [Puccinia striiformis f. sp. tritici]|nr:hypothetical protein MJO29_011152 [Puccinia striiformis f. sp. tritici]
MAQDDEIKAYLKAVLNFKEEDLQHKTTPLKWWKANQQTYPTLATLACAYLGATQSLREPSPLKNVKLC